MIASTELIYNRLSAAGVPTDRDAVRIKAVPVDSILVDPLHASNLDGDEFAVEAIANTAAIDLDDEVVLPSGADPTYFDKNRSILYNHSSDLPVGKMVWRKFDKQRNRWVVRMNIGKATPFQRDLRAMVAEGSIRGVSIGFLAMDFGRPSPEEIGRFGKHRSIVRVWKWMELSLTALPCNVEAIIASSGKGAIGRKSAELMTTLLESQRDRYTLVI